MHISSQNDQNPFMSEVEAAIYVLVRYWEGARLSTLPECYPGP
jgi:hypothetical protein